MKENIHEILGWIDARLIDPETFLVYDAETDPRELPLPEEARSRDPNPCGYGTGMEDSMIHGGTLLDACVTLWEKYRDPQAERLGHRVLSGMLRCAEAARAPGFLPRSLCPADGVSHYPDSSIDQYTMFVFGAHRAVYTGFADETERARLAKVADAFAERAERNMRDGLCDMETEDGRPSRVCRMWSPTMGNHERFRLPALYLCAWELTGDDAWLSAYRSLREEALSKSLPMGGYWHLYCLQQAQASLAVARDLETEEEFRGRIREVMLRVDEFARTQVEATREGIRRSGELLSPYPGFRSLPRHPQEGWGASGYEAVERSDAAAFWFRQDAAQIPLISLYAGLSPAEDALDLMRETLNALDPASLKAALPVHFAAVAARMQ